MNLAQGASIIVRAMRNHPLSLHLSALVFFSGLTAGSAAEQQPQSPASGTGKTGSELVRKTSFKEVTSQLDSGGTMYLYLSTDQWLARLGSDVSALRDFIASLPNASDPNREQVEHVFDFLAKAIHECGVEQLAGVGASNVELAPGLYRTKWILHAREGSGEGPFWNLLGQQAHPLTSINMLPTNTALAMIGDVDPASAWRAIERWAQDSKWPEAARGLDEWQKNFEKGTKLSWAKLLDSVNGEAGVILTLDNSRKVKLPVGGETLELPEPGLVLLVKVKNDMLYDRLSQQLKGNSQTVETDEAGLKMCAMPLPLPLPMPVSLTVASTGDYFLASTSPELVRSVLGARRDGGAALVKNEEFKGLLQHLPEQGNQIVYLDKRFSSTLIELQRKGMQAGSKSPAQSALFERFLGGREASFGLAISGRTPTGWQSVSVGNRDASGALLMPAVAAVAIPAAMVLPALAKAKSRAQSINCVNNLKQIGLAFRIWATDNGDQFPFHVSTSKGGSLELCKPGEGGFDENSFRHFQVLSNELNTPKILVCPADPSKQVAADFASLQANNVTYLLRSGTNVNETSPQEVLARCPVHGHVVLCDGSVQQGRGK
jgi:hypothetical protein